MCCDEPHCIGQANSMQQVVIPDIESLHGHSRFEVWDQNHCTSTTDLDPLSMRVERKALTASGAVNASTAEDVVRRGSQGI